MLEYIRTLVVGGHSRNTGKTSLVVDLLRAFPDAGWTAVKITQYGHEICALHGNACDCAPEDHSVALDEESERNDRTDTSRFLVAGAARSWWLRTPQGKLAEAMPLLRERLRGAGNVIVESNSLLQFLRPDLYLVVLNPDESDFKDTARLYATRADAFVLRREWHNLAEVAWQWNLPPRLLEEKPSFLQPLGSPLPGELRAFVQKHFFH